MEKPRLLSGEALVAKGTTKVDASLPEVGLKDVIPNGSWLEQKQIQAALEARKHLIEVERIEKCGTLSHAEWRDELMLAEVTHKTGGYWQYLGHNVGKILYLRPEETLFLMEINCLLLKHNEVTVPLQKAYSLLLSSSTTMIQYKVYASLSRLGYKVFRHTGPRHVEEKQSNSQNMKDINNSDLPTVSMDNESKHFDSSTAEINKSECVNSPISNIVAKTEKVDAQVICPVNESEEVDSPIVSTGNVSKKVDSVILSALNNADNNGSPIVPRVNKSENLDSIVNTAIEPEKAESGTPIDKTVTDPKSDSTPVVNDTVIDSEMDDTPKANTIHKSENHDSQTIRVYENEQVNDKVEIKGSERIGNIAEMCVVEESEKKVAKFNAEYNVAKENESPNIMEVDETPEVKTADDKIEIKTIQEVSSTVVTNVEDKIENMEINAENQEAVSGIVLMEESDDKSKNIEAISAEVSNSMVTAQLPVDLVEVVNASEDAVSFPNSEVVKRDTGTQTLEVNTKSLEDVPNINDRSYSHKCNRPTENVTQNVNHNEKTDPHSYLGKIKKIMKRQLRSSKSRKRERCFKNIPDLSKEHVVTINVPEQKYMPKNIFVNKAAYTLDLQNIKLRSIRSTSSESPTYTSSDEVNGTNIRRIRSSLDALGTEFPQNPNYFPHGRFPNYLRYQQFRPYGFWRPQNNLNFYQLMFFHTRVQYHQRPHLLIRPPCFSINPNNLNISNNARKRIRNGKTAHFQGIKNLAVRLKQSLISGNNDMSNLETLHSLLHSYNLRYKTRLRLTETFDVVNEEKIVETIDLDGDEESKSKKPRLDKEDDGKFDENLYRLRQLAVRLRELETKGQSSASHRRAFSKAIKTFNKSYNADIYMDNDNYEVIDRRCITLDTSSESDCVVEEQPQIRSKKLRNPFNILKRRKERLQSLNNPSTSKDHNSSASCKTDPRPEEAYEDNNKYSELTLKTFNESWLPSEKDFGRAEIVPKRLMNSRLEFSNKELFLYEYMKGQFRNWFDAKISFLRYLEETNIAFKNEQARILADAELCNTGLKPLVDFEDGSDMPAVLEKLRIIQNNKEMNTEINLTIDFDVYNRNVQNFRKRNPPKPHFRIICIDESSGVPSAAHVMSLQSKYEDNVPIVFAIVGTGAISYLQINPIDLPVYVPRNDGV